MKHTLTPGSTQVLRLIRALSPDSFKLDDRTWQDFITTAHRYAQWLTYYDDANLPCGNWAGFWQQEALTYLAVLAALDTDQMRRDYEEIEIELAAEMEKYLDPDDDSCMMDPWPSYILKLIEHARRIACITEQIYFKLRSLDHPLAAMLLSRIKKDNDCDFDELAGALQRLISYNMAAAGNDLNDEVYAVFYNVQPSIGKDDLTRWGVVGKTAYDLIPAHGELPTREEMRDVFKMLMEALLVLKTRAQVEFEAELTRVEKPEAELYRVVQPHIALFITFLHLFRHVQDDMNELPSKHLTYYYEDVLGLTRRPARPDHAYIIFQLAKGIQSEFVEKGTLLIGGKDKKGKPLYYETLHDWTARAAQVADIKNTYIDIASDYPYPPEDNSFDPAIATYDAQLSNIVANPDVKKAYANGEEVANEKINNWRGMADDPELPTAEVGFAISSPQLILREGKRVVDVTMYLSDEIAGPDLDDLGVDHFRLYLSSEEEWIKLSRDNSIDFNEITALNQVPELDKASFRIRFDDAEKLIRIRIILERDDLPVVQPGAKFAPDTGFTSPWPVLKVVIDPEIEDTGSPEDPEDRENPEGNKLEQKFPRTSARVYRRLRTLQLKEIIIKVSAFGIRENLIIQSDQGTFDGTQKVYPFGPVPEIDSNFYIGSTEVFQKALSQLEVRFDWIDAPGNLAGYYQEYTDVLNITPKPFVRIDFIDRAIGASAKQVEKSGTRGADNIIKGRITDVDGKGLIGVKVRLTDATDNTKKDEVETLPDADGKYTLTATNVTNFDGATIQFIPPDPSPTSSPEEKFYEKLEKVMDPLNPSAGKSFIKVDAFAIINAVLFTRSTRFGKYPEKLTGRITDVYGGAIENVTDITLNDEKFEAGGTVKIEVDGTAPMELKFGFSTELLEIYNEINEGDPVILYDFSEVEVVLEPKEVVNIPERAEGLSLDPNADKFVEGTILKIEDSTFIQNAVIEFNDSDNQQKIKAFSNGSGRYKIPVKGGNSTLGYYAGFYEHLISEDIRTPLKKERGLRATVNAKLFTPQLVEEVFSDGKVSLNIVDYLGKVLEVEGEIDEGDIIITRLQLNGDFSDDGISFLLPDTTKETHKIELTPIPGVRNTLKFSSSHTTNFEEIIVDVDDYTHLEIEMFPENGIAISGEELSDAKLDVTIHVFNYDGERINNVVISESDDGTKTATPKAGAVGEYEITLSAKDKKLSFTLAPYKPRTDIKVINNIIHVILKPDNIITINPDSVAGTIIDAKGIALSGINVVLEGEIPASIGNNAFVKYERDAPTPATGNFSLGRLNTVIKKKLTFTDDDGYITEVINLATSEIDGVHSKKVKRARSAPTSLSGIISNLEGEALEGVRVFNGAAFLAISDDTGLYSVEIPAPFPVTFYHPFYNILTVDVEAGCLQLHVRLIPRPGVYGVASGVVRDVYENEIPGADLSIREASTYAIDDTFLTQSGSDGTYRLVKIPLLPAGLPKLNFKFEKYESVEIDHTTSSGGFARSMLDVFLTFTESNFVNLVNDEEGIKTDIPVTIPAQSRKRDVRTQQFEKFIPTLKRGFIRFTLTEGDFLHKEYQKVLLTQSLKLAKEVSDGTDPTTIILPKPPYPPATNGISVDYISEQKILTENEGIDGYFHAFPFKGNKRISMEKIEVVTQEGIKEKVPPVIPFINAYAPNDSAADSDKQSFGNLYIGLSGLEPNATLSLLVQIAEGSEKNPDDLVPKVYWSYLTKNNWWQPFKPEEITEDGTKGLTRSGIIRFVIPAAVSREGNTMLNPELWWLRAACVKDVVEMNAGAFPGISAIDAQAVEVQFRDSDNEPSHLAKPLPDGSINRLAFSRSVVKSVSQPLPSFDGRLPENAGTEYFRRVSERLRHKDRAVTPYDFERLLLERYGGVLAAKAIPHTRYEKDSDTKKTAERTAPGFVTVAVIPGLRQRPLERRKTPRLPKGDLLLIEEYLLTRTTLHLQKSRLQVLNPLYEKIQIVAEIEFYPDADVKLSKTLTIEALNRFIAHWVENTNESPAFGRCIYRSQLIALLENLDFVDFVNEMYVYRDETLVEGYMIEPSTARSILTTLGAHTIIPPDKELPKGEDDKEIIDTPPSAGDPPPYYRAAVAPPPGAADITTAVTSAKSAESTPVKSVAATKAAPPKPSVKPSGRPAPVTAVAAKAKAPKTPEKATAKPAVAAKPAATPKAPPPQTPEKPAKATTVKPVTKKKLK